MRRIRGVSRRLGSLLGAGHSSLAPLRRECLSPGLAGASKSHGIAQRQRALTDTQLLQMRRGNVIEQWWSLTEAVESTGDSPEPGFEVANSTGYDLEVSEYLVGHPVDYVGVDYVEAIIVSARAHYQEGSIGVGQASCSMCPTASRPNDPGSSEAHSAI